MAGSDLVNFLKKLDTELRSSSETYRTQVSDRKPHTFFVTKDGLYANVVAQAELDGVKSSRRDIKKATDKYFDSLVSLARKSKSDKNFIVYDVTVSATSMSITFELLKSFKSDRVISTTFELVKLFTRSADRSFLIEMGDIYKGKGRRLNRSEFLDIGHEEQSAVINQRKYDALLSYGEIPQKVLKIKEVASLFDIVKDDKKDTISVTLETATLNRLKGRTDEKVIKDKLLADLKVAIEKLEIAKVRGSDSIEQRKVKETTKAVLDPIRKVARKSKNITVTPAKEDIKYSSKAKKENKKSRTISATSKGRKAPRLPKQEDSLVSFNKLFGALNQALPETVAKNMGSPRLEYRTGRFASSVRITDITQTRQGYPSIGYTYMTNPYQTFERGNRQGSVNRDPRSLIDLSIREIAAKMVMGRFYTRRV